MNIDARGAGPPSFSFALQSPRSCSNCTQCVCMPDYLNLCFVINHVKSIATNAQMHASVPQPHVNVLWLPEVGMVLLPKKYVLLRAKALEMISKSLNVGDLISTGCSAGPWATACSPRDRARTPPTTNTQRHTSVPAACQCALVS